MSEQGLGVHSCCICGRNFIGWGNDPWPVVKDEESLCCNDCNMRVVIPARLRQMSEFKEKDNGNK